MALLVLFLTQLDFSGYIETRPYIAWNDSINIFGYNRGWLELKHDGTNYGTQVSLDCLVPYDTIGFAYLTEKLNISRLALWLGTDRLRISAGKQRLYWGVGRVFRPLDVFNPVNFLEPRYERPGSNAFLGDLSISRLSNIRLIYVPQFNLKKSFMGLRLGTNFLKNDIGFNIMHKPLPRKSIMGMEITGDQIIGYWCEASYTVEDTAHYAQASIGLDYTFPFMIYSMLDFFYDESGEDNPSNYDYTKIITRERTTLGKQYLYLSIGLVHSPFFEPSLNSIINLNDKGFIAIPQVTYSITDNVEMVSGFNFFIGSETSEFRNLVAFDGQFYIWLKVYF